MKNVLKFTTALLAVLVVLAVTCEITLSWAERTCQHVENRRGRRMWREEEEGVEAVAQRGGGVGEGKF